MRETMPSNRRFSMSPKPHNNPERLFLVKFPVECVNVPNVPQSAVARELMSEPVRESHYPITTVPDSPIILDRAQIGGET
jgi:hypothetical protein